LGSEDILKIFNSFDKLSLLVKTREGLTTGIMKNFYVYGKKLI
jgi:hypothetical protein